MGEIIYNGRSSREIGLEVETFPEYRTPKRTYEKIHVPGRNGDLIIDNGCWENVQKPYQISLGSYERSYTEMMNKLSEWLHSSTTYVRLEDSYEPDYFRLAVFLEEFEISNIFNHGGKATVEFDCKPQRFLKRGEDSIVLKEKSSNIQNPTSFSSKPIIHVYGTGTGTLMVGDCTISITDIGSHMIIDSEIQDVYLDTTNKNDKVKLPNGFPELDPGIISIGYSGGITSVEVIPKWFTL